MKRYLLFMCYVHYPSGGWNDFIGDYASLEKANKRLKEIRAQTTSQFDWHIVDTKINQVLHSPNPRIVKQGTP